MSVNRWFARADRSIASASLIYASGDYDSSCSTSYFAMFYAARAALTGIGHEERAMTRADRSIVSAVGLHLVRPCLMDPKHGRSFASELKRRVRVDHGEGGAGSDEATRAIAGARAFVDADKAVCA